MIAEASVVKQVFKDFTEVRGLFKLLRNQLNDDAPRFLCDVGMAAAENAFQKSCLANTRRSQLCELTAALSLLELALAANLKSLDSWRATFSFIYYLEAATKKNYILLCQARVHVLLGDVDAVNEIISKIVRKPVMTIWHKLALVLSVLLDGVRRLFRGNPYWARYRKRADLDRAIKQILSAMSRPGLLQLFRKCDAATQQVGQFCSFVRSVVVGWLRHAVPGPDRRCIDAAWLLPEFIRPVVRALPNIDCG